MGDRQEAVALRRTLLMSAGFTVLVGISACAQPSGVGASGSTMPAHDTLGAGGQTDNVYRQIYHPGSGTDF